ncbi:MAG: hypothetical protein AAF560_08125 [Acidobacteriota bacterium]
MSRSVLIQVLLLTFAPALLGQGFTTPPEDAPRLGEPTIEAGRLLISVLWPQEVSTPYATLEVVDGDGAVAGSTQVSAEPGGEVTYAVTQNLDFIARHGYSYRVRLVDFQGVELAPDVGALVALCPSSEGCRYRMVEGVAADAVSMSSELFELLEYLEAVGSTDLLADALVLRPELDFEIYWVADQIAQQQEGGEGEECICSWIADLEVAPSGSSEQDLVGEAPAPGALPDWREYRLTGPGANLRLAAQMLGGRKRSMTASGGGRAGLHLRCRSTVGWTPVVWAGLELRVPRLDPCSRACPDTLIVGSAWATSSVRANAVTSASHGAQGRARVSVEYFEDDGRDPVFTAAADVELARSPGDPRERTAYRDSGLPSAERVVWGRDASARLSVTGEVETCLAVGSAEPCPEDYQRPLFDDGSWAFAQARAASRAELVGQASCAQVPVQQVTLRQQLKGTGSKDGALIVPWRP